MVRFASLKRFARTQLDRLDREFPVFTWERTSDPIRLNAIFSPREWELDSPVVDLSEDRQDWMHWYACDPAGQTYLEIFFKRFQEQVTSVWVKLQINGRVLVLDQAFLKDSSDGHAYGAGGIRLECTAPMRGWRVALNLIMSDIETGNKIHVRLGAQVAMTGHTFELPKQVRPSFLARVYEEEENFEHAKSEIAKCCGRCQAIMQPFSAFAEIVLDGERQELMLFGNRFKFFGNSNFLQDLPIYIGYAENGTTFVAAKVGGKAYGYCSNPITYVQPMRKTRWRSSLSGRIEKEKADHDVDDRLDLEAAGRKHEIELVSQDVDGRAGNVGRLNIEKRTYLSLNTILKLPEHPVLPGEKLKLIEVLRFPAGECDSLLLSTSERACKNSRLTGGKGRSLAVLTDVSKVFKTFTVPSAVVLTVNAYAMFSRIPEVSKAIEEFIESSKLSDMAELRTASEKCVSAISNVALPEPIRQLLFGKLDEIFGPLWYSKKFAVRSSAVGEDSEEMSAAGQMTTFLGMKGERKISKAVVECWASQFALTAVNYKRQYGQPLNSSMAVVVQEMVSAESAGVMFTCDPVTSNPSKIFITANFGLGESVVSASADPDTYSLRRAGPEVVLESKSCGAKDRMIVELEDGSGTEEKSTASEQARTFTLSDERAIEIASIGALLTDITDSPRDIEWAVVSGNIYLLQSRPVTSFLRESDFEVRHDFNSGLYTNREILSRANLDEVMPGVFSPMGCSIVAHLLFETYTKRRKEWGNYDRSQFTYVANAICGRKNFMNLSHNGLTENKTMIKSTAVTMFGYDITDHEALKKGIAHVGEGAKSWSLTAMTLSVFGNIRSLVDEVRKQADLMRIDLPENGDSLASFLSVLSQIQKMEPFMVGLIGASMPSGFYNMLTLNTVKSSQGSEDFSPDLMILLSKLLKSDLQVESAHIPNELTTLSNLLREDPNAANFVEMTPKDALAWLETAEGDAAKQFRTLRSKHAHRCYKEFDVYSKTWDIDPLPLVQTLQSTAKGPQPEMTKANEERLTVDQLPKRPSLLQRAILNFLIPRAQYAVYAREAAKSALIKSIHKVRLAIRRVAQQLHAEGKLPDPELVFFFSCDELYRLMTTKDPTLLPKAFRRQKMHPILDQERFPVLFYGMPKPIDESKIEIDPNAESMSGVPVSEGKVVGPARVILDFVTQAHLIQKGEILITRATDTGWTPYFPLLGGVVTEVGGLLSHGAVVAREFGLPAIVGVNGVTHFVKSGDIVTLDGNKGILQKSPPAEGELSAVEKSEASSSVASGSSEATETELGNPSELEPTSQGVLRQEERTDVVEKSGDHVPLIECQA